MYLTSIPSQSLGLRLSQEELKFLFTLNSKRNAVKMRTSIQAAKLFQKLKLWQQFLNVTFMVCLGTTDER
jgi:hypothetical protein